MRATVPLSLIRQVQVAAAPGAISLAVGEPSHAVPAPVRAALEEAVRRGDFRYSFTFPEPKNATGRMEILVQGQSHNVTVDPVTRLAWAHIELTGQGAPADTPAPGLALALAGVAAAAFALRGRRALR